MSSVAPRAFRSGWTRAVLMVAALAAAGAPASTGAASLPDTVSAPKSINLGSTSFFDGFGRTDEGWTLLQYARYENLTRITDDQGQDNPLFKGTDIQVFVAQTQLSYTSSWHPLGGDGVGISALLPFAAFRSSFQQDSPVKLNHDEFGQGDLSIGPFYQSPHAPGADGTMLSWRAQLSITAPTGSVDEPSERVSLNQGSGFWALNPYLAVTWLPTARIDLNARVNYQYNFATTAIQNPPPIPGLVYHNGQAGAIVYGNFAAAYAVTAAVFLGVNGYALTQLDPDKTNGQQVAHSQETELSVGPGARYVVDAADALNLNLYLPVVSRNATSGTQLNLQFVHRF